MQPAGVKRNPVKSKLLINPASPKTFPTLFYAAVTDFDRAAAVTSRANLPLCEAHADLIRLERSRFRVLLWRPSQVCRNSLKLL